VNLGIPLATSFGISSGTTKRKETFHVKIRETEAENTPLISKAGQA